MSIPKLTYAGFDTIQEAILAYLLQDTDKIDLKELEVVSSSIGLSLEGIHDSISDSFWRFVDSRIK